jgi:hypothetical protein
MHDIVEPFTILYGAQMFENAIANLVNPRRDKAHEIIS